jgi:putative membrane protein
MNRRHMLTALPAAALLLSGVALAQSENADAKHIADTSRVGSLALLTSRLAKQRASNAEVKQFANFEVAEQETAANVLTSIKNDDKPSGEVKPPSDAEAEAHLDAKGKAALEKLRKLSGAAFDKEYVKGQLEGHQALLKIQEDFLKKGGPREQINVAKLLRGMVKEHITLLTHLSKKV